MMWRRSLLLSSLLLLSLLPICSEGNPDPATMTVRGIYAELSEISERQLKRWEMLETELPQLQLRAETLATDLETLSLSLTKAERTLQDRTNSLQSSAEDLEREARSLKAMNIVLLILTGMPEDLQHTLYSHRRFRPFSYTSFGFVHVPPETAGVFMCNEILRMVRRFRRALAIHKENPILLSKVRLLGSTEKKENGKWIVRV